MIDQEIISPPFFCPWKSRFLGGLLLLKRQPQGIPNQQRTFDEFPTELRCGNVVNKHRLSIQIGAKRAKNVYAMCTYSY